MRRASELFFHAKKKQEKHSGWGRNTLTNTSVILSKRGQYRLQTLVLLTAVAAVSFLAYAKHAQTRRLKIEIEMLRNLLLLKSELPMQRKVLGDRHPEVVEVENKIKAIESEMSDLET